MNPEIPIPNQPTPETPPPKRKGRLGSWLPLIVLPAVFGVGFIPMWLKSSRLTTELHRSKQELQRT